MIQSRLIMDPCDAVQPGMAHGVHCLLPVRGPSVASRSHCGHCVARLVESRPAVSSIWTSSGGTSTHGAAASAAGPALAAAPRGGIQHTAGRGLPTLRGNGPRNGPPTDLDSLLFFSWPRKSLRNRFVTILSHILELTLRLFSRHLPLIYCRDHILLTPQ